MDMEIFLVKKYVIYIKSEMRANHSKNQRGGLAQPVLDLKVRWKLCRLDIKKTEIKNRRSRPT